MDVELFQMKLFSPSDPHFRYTGRFDPRDPQAPRWFYAGNMLSACFEGTSLGAVLSDAGDWWKTTGNRVGFLIDQGPLIEVPLVKGEALQKVAVASGLADGPHTLTMVKLDGPGAGGPSLAFHGLALDAGKGLLPPPAPAPFKLEMYGDSITEGEGAGCPAGTHDCGQNSAWLAYSGVAARLLNAELHNLGIGGLAVRNETGYYNSAHYGLELTYDRMQPFGDLLPWDFTRFRPDLVVMAMGVNDASTHALDDLEGWKARYKAVVRAVVGHHGLATPVLFTVMPIQTVGDQAFACVQQVSAELRGEGLRTDEFFGYDFRANGHPNQVESEAIGRALAQAIQDRAIQDRADTLHSPAR